MGPFRFPFDQHRLPQEFTEPKLIFHTDEIDRENRRKRVKEVIENPAYLAPPIRDDEDYIAECYNKAVFPYQGFYIGFPTIFNPFGAAPPPGTNHSRWPHSSWPSTGFSNTLESPSPTAFVGSLRLPGNRPAS